MLLEYDSRFSIFPEYVFYDYNQSLKLPGKHRKLTSHDRDIQASNANRALLSLRRVPTGCRGPHGN